MGPRYPFGPKHFWFKKMLCQKYLWVQIILNPKKVRGTKFGVYKVFVEEISIKQIFDKKKSWSVTEILLILINVTKTNVAWTNVTVTVG